MTIVPASAAAGWAATQSRLAIHAARDVLAGAAVTGEGGIAIDTRYLDEETRGQVEEFWNACHRAVQEDDIRVDRLVRAAQAVDSAGVRSWLTDERDALRDECDLQPIVDTLLSPVPPDQLTCATAGPALLHDSGPGEGSRRVTLRVTPRDLPDVLGGPTSRREEARLVSLTIRHAKHRDTAVKRLAALRVIAQERWPRIHRTRTGS